MSRMRIGIAVVLALCALGTRPSAAAKDPLAKEWTETLESLDAERSLTLIRRVTNAKPKDEKIKIARSFSLFQAATRSRHHHVSIALGDALRATESKLATHKPFKSFVSKMVRKSDKLVRQNIATILGAWALPEFDETLARLACVKPGPDRQEALLMCGAMPNDGKWPQTYAAIQKSLKHRDAATRVAACMAAGRRGEKALAEQLVHIATQDRDMWVGRFAVRALERLRYPVPAATFAKRLATKVKPGTRIACRKGLVTLTPPSDIDELFELLGSRDEVLVRVGVLGISRIAASNSFTELVSPDPEKPLEPLSKEDRQRALRELFAVIEAKHPRSIHEAAARAMGRIGGPVPELLQKDLLRLIAAKDADLAVFIIRVCARLQIQEAFDPLMKVALESRSPVIRRTACRALDLLDRGKALPELLKLISESRMRKARRAAMEALEYIKSRDNVEALVDFLGKEELHRDDRPLVENHLEKLTGHRFGSDPKAWLAWLKDAKSVLKQPLPHIDRHELRKKVVAEKLYGITAASENAMQRGLDWLARCQYRTGYWDARDSGWDGHPHARPAYTAMVLTAFTNAGYRPHKGLHRETVWRAAEYLAAAQRFTGGMISDEDSTDWRTSASAVFSVHGFTLWAGSAGTMKAHLADPKGLWRGATQRGLDRYADTYWWRGGWGPGELSNAETAHTMLAALVFGVAWREQFELDPWAWDAMESWLWQVASDMSGEKEHPADRSNDHTKSMRERRKFKAFAQELPLTGPSRFERERFNIQNVVEQVMLARIVLGFERSHPLIVGGAQSLIERLPVWMEPPPGEPITWLHAYWMFGTYALVQVGGRHWSVWRGRVTRMYSDNQRLDPAEFYGSWDPNERLGERDRLYSTVLSTVALQAPYAYPIRLAGK